MSVESEHPSNYADAVRRRAELVGEVVKLQSLLGDKDKQRSARSRREYDDWKKGVMEKYQVKLEELRKVKDWIKLTPREGPGSRRKQELEKDWDGTVDTARHAFNDLWQYVSFLESRVSELQLENEQLKQTQDIPL